MEEVVVPIPPDSTGASLADWGEAIMFLEDRELLSRAELRDRLSDATLGEAEIIDDTDTFDEPGRSEELDTWVDFLLAEVDTRSQLSPTAYPFSTTPEGIARRQRHEPDVYEFLLWLSISQPYRASRERAGDSRFGDTEHLFNTVVKQALIGYLGPGTQAIEFAANSIDGRPTNFSDAIDWLAEKLQLPRGSALRFPESKDGGVDIVAWHAFGDGRIGSFLVVLCQCTVGYDWTPKARDINPDLWRDWIMFGRNPLTALAIPFLVPGEFHKWEEIRRRADIILNRYRLSVVMATGHAQPQADSIAAWCQEERRLLVDDPSAISYE